MRVPGQGHAQGGFAAAVGAHEHHQVARGDIEGDGLQHAALANGHAQIARAVAYVRDISEIATEAHQQFIEITQAWIGHLKASLDSAVREASSSASAGSGALFSALFSIAIIGTIARAS